MTRVPLALPGSWMVNCLPSRVRLVWRRETSGSLTTARSTQRTTVETSLDQRSPDQGGKGLGEDTFALRDPRGPMRVDRVCCLNKRNLPPLSWSAPIR